MFRKTAIILIASAIVMIGARRINQAEQQSAPAKAQTARGTATRSASVEPTNGATTMTVEAGTALINKYCVGCHNEKLKSGNMSLAQWEIAHPEKTPELTEKIIRMVRVGLMPKAPSPRPDTDTLRAFAASLETVIDKNAALRPNPGGRPFQRLTRDEYARSVYALLGIEVDVAKFLPPDSLSDGLDNIADSQAFSPALMAGYIRAADSISRQAIGDHNAGAASEVFKLSRTASQLRHVDGAPFGTRGGISTIYNFPADGEYSFRSLLHSTSQGGLFGNVPDEQLEISIDGERVALLTIDLNLSEGLATSLNVYSGKIFARTGPHRVSAAFIQKHSEIIEDNIAEIEHTLGNSDIGSDQDLTEYPHLREFEITGPYTVTGVSDTSVRRRIFSCRPLSPDDELPCATKILNALARQAYRRPVSADDMEGLMNFYQEGRKNGDFESGIRFGLQAILASLDFVFKFEKAPAGVKPGQIFRIGDVELASRLSYFLWGAPPDDELLGLAEQGKLKDRVVLEKQVRRMLLDSRSESLSTKFAGEWLHLPDLENLNPDLYYYPFYDYTLAMGLKRETELFFDSIVREDRDVLDLLTADYTFVNGRVAKHYGIPGVREGDFRRVTVPQDYRRGLLGKGAILALTSVADRTSPVLRGKWVMGVLLGTPPPPPPPSVPKLDATSAVAGGKTLTVRERMEVHRKNPTCNSCHQLIDPIGLALENFDVTGQWRDRDATYAIGDDGTRIHTAGVPIDPTTKLYDGTILKGPVSLREALLNHSDAFIANLTEKLMAYAIGRRMEYNDLPVIRAIDREAAKKNNRFSSLVLGIVNSAAFQMREASAPATIAAAAAKN